MREGYGDDGFYHKAKFAFYSLTKSNFSLACYLFQLGEPIPKEVPMSTATEDHGKGYLISVNGKEHTVEKPTVTRGEVAHLADVGSVEEVCVRVHTSGAKPRVLQPDEEVDLTVPGIEHFQVDKECIVKVKVNKTTFQLAVPTTGEGVKRAAIEAGANIKLDFALFLDLEDRPPEQVNDAEAVFVDEGACFSAVAGDDNS